MKKKYLVEPSEQEREYLHKLISSGTAPARKSNRARILLKVQSRRRLKAPFTRYTQALEREAGAWCEERNRLGTSVDWRFTTEAARIKLRELYPSIDT